MCGDRGIEGDRCWLGALKCGLWLRFRWARSGVSPDGDGDVDVDGYRRSGRD